MIDIVSIIREKIFRRPKLVPVVAGEELSEKQTTKMGYFLLVCMFFAILSSAQWTLSIIKNIPTVPNQVPYCVIDVVSAFRNQTLTSDYRYDSYRYYGYTNNAYTCTLVSNSPKFDFTEEYSALQTPYSKLQGLLQQIQTLENRNQDTHYNQEQYQDDYNTSLMEDMAGGNGIYDRNQIGQNIVNGRENMGMNTAQISDLKSQVSSLISENQNLITRLEEKVDAANRAYSKAYLMYKLIIAVLSFIFALGVFFILYKLYIKYKLANSPHTIIFSFATFAYGLIVLQVASLFLWDIIPHKIFTLLLQFISAFAPLMFLVQFLWPVLIIAIFGFAVYKIQKRLYSPENVLKRFIADKKCPNCGNSVDFTKPFCPLCSHEIQIHCPLCHELTVKGMPHCSNCGGKLPEKDVISFRSEHIFDSVMEQELSKVDISNYSGVRFIPNTGNTFTSNRANVVRIVAYMVQKFNKTEFAPNELSALLENVSKHINSANIKEAELNRIMGKIKSWVELGGSVSLMNK